MTDEHIKPPSAIDEEMIVLGCMLRDKVAAATVFERLSPEHFFKSKHKVIFIAGKALYDQGKDIDILTVNDVLNKEKRSGETGGPFYLSELIDRVPSVELVNNAIRIVHDRYVCRRILAMGMNLVNESQNKRLSADEIISKAETELFELASENETSDFRHIREDLELLSDRLELAYNHPGKITGLETGYETLDRCTNGMLEANLIILAARPSMGKTALALDIAKNIASRGIPVGIFSLEMSHMQLQSRLIASDAKVDSQKMRLGKLEKKDWGMITRSFEKLSKLPVYIDDARQPMEAIRAKARRGCIRYGIKLIIVDHLQIVDIKSKYGSRQVEIGMITAGLKQLAKELYIPVLCLSQLSRNNEYRTDKMPRLSDLRESGNIEQDADNVYFLHRPEYYGDETIKIGENTISTLNLAILRIAKQRDGEVGKDIRLYFNKQSVTFSEMDMHVAEKIQNNDDELPF